MYCGESNVVKNTEWIWARHCKCARSWYIAGTQRGISSLSLWAHPAQSETALLPTGGPVQGKKHGTRHDPFRL
jgi:hypothetical protein